MLFNKTPNFIRHINDLIQRLHFKWKSETVFNATVINPSQSSGSPMLPP
jgi:hypothetical protein